MSTHPITLNRFVLRARRIAAHSLASSSSALSALSEFTLTGHIKLDGTMEMRRVLPDEEAFESLAARLRPVLLKSESVHHAQVLAAIESALDATGTIVPEDLQARFAGLRDGWSRFDLDSSNVLRFAVQSSRTDGSETTPQVSDTQLAAAWLYGDLVHVDTHGAKSEGLLFPVKERYSAAVTYFAHAAVLILTTLNLVMALHELGVVVLDEESLEQDVVVGVDELVDEAVAYIGPVSSPMPSLDIAKELPSDFRPFTVTELLRQTPTNQVQVVLTSDDGSTVAEYEAAVSRRQEQDDRLHWEALVAGAVTFEVSFDMSSGDLMDSRFEGITSHATTNRMKLAEAMLSREMATSRQISFHVASQKFFTLSLAPHEAEEVTYLDVSIDTLYDLVVIENITHQALQPLTGNYRSTDRAVLRRSRLLWEGEIVPFRSGPLPTTAAAGVVPQVIVIPAEQMSIGDIQIPMPTICIRHPHMRPEGVTDVLDSEPPADWMMMVVASGEPFVAWAPDRRLVHGDDDLQQPTPWALSHFDEHPFLGGSTKEES